MAQYVFIKVYVGETKQDVYVKKKTNAPVKDQLQRWPRSQGQLF